MASENELLTVGQIADTLAEPPARVAYVIGKYRIKPIQRIGIIRLFNPQQVETIRREIFNSRLGVRR